MATDARVTSIQFERPEEDLIRGMYSRSSDMTRPVDDRKRTMTITYEWFGKGAPPNLPEIVKDHPELIHINFGG